MDKRDWIWVAIRIFGIYMLVLAVTGVPSLISYGWMALTFWRMQPTPSGDDSNKLLLDTMVRAKVSYAGLLGAQIVRVTLFTLVGVYLLRSGRLIFRLILPPERPSAPPTEGQ